MEMLDELKSESLKRERMSKLTTESYQMVDSIQIGGGDKILLEKTKITIPAYEPMSNIIEGMKESLKEDN
jgi:hypothetical protein